DGGFASRTWALDEDIHGLHAMLHGAPGSVLGTHLGRERGALAGALEPGGAGAAPGDRIAGHVGDGDQGVIECGVDVSLAARDGFTFSPPAAGPLRCLPSHRSSVSLLLGQGLAAAGDSLARP